MDGATTLYRLYDADGQLLYVGIAVDTERRFAEHAKTKPWWPQVARTDLDHHRYRTDAQDAERAAIRTECPLHNIAETAGRGFTAWLLLQAHRPDPTGQLARHALDDTCWPDVAPLGDHQFHLEERHGGHMLRALDRAWIEWKAL